MLSNIPNNFTKSVLITAFDYYGILDDDVIMKIYEFESLTNQVADSCNKIFPDKYEFKLTFSMVDTLSSDDLKKLNIVETDFEKKIAINSRINQSSNDEQMYKLFFSINGSIIYDPYVCKSIKLIIWNDKMIFINLPLKTYLTFYLNEPYTRAIVDAWNSKFCFYKYEHYYSITFFSAPVINK